ncbi:MAG: RNA polymerase sigma factor [Bacteroidetes bacterium]|nr:RNA polymerase sigma factor [Bacteroidota bacterium]
MSGYVICYKNINEKFMSLTPDISIQIADNRQHLILQDPELVRLIDGCINNDRSAQEAMYKRYYGKMMSLCRRYVKDKDEALSVLNLGFLKVFKSISGYNYSGAFDGWMHRIVYHSIIDQLRSKMREMKTSEIQEADNIDAQTISGLDNLYAEDLFNMLDELPESTRMVFNMFAIEGYKHEEIADMLGISAGTSKWHVNQARTQLKALILKTYLKS